MDGRPTAFAPVPGSPCLVLSLFPGIGLLDHAFELEGFTVVRGPDKLWGGDVRRFRAMPGRFDGIIGGPPCQRFSALNQAGRMGLQPLAANLIPEYERIVSEAQPSWFVMENVPAAPLPVVPGYVVRDYLVNNRWFGGEQHRRRRFSFGTRAGKPLPLEFAALEHIDYAPCVTANGTQWEPGKPAGEGGRSRSDRSVKALKNYVAWQGLPADFLADAPFTVEGKVHVVGNGVPIPMGRAVAQAVRIATGNAEVTDAGSVTQLKPQGERPGVRVD